MTADIDGRRIAIASSVVALGATTLLTLHCFGIVPLATRVERIIDPQPFEGHAFTAPLGSHQFALLREPVASVYEDGRGAFIAHADQRELVAKYGRGRYHIGGNTVYFSATDNTDPRTNGRTYSIRGPVPIPTALIGLGWLLSAVIAAGILVWRRRQVSAALSRHGFIIAASVFLLVLVAHRLWFYVDVPIVAVHPDSGNYYALSEQIQANMRPQFGVRPPGYPVMLRTVFSVTDKLYVLSVVQAATAAGAGLLLILAAYRIWPLLGVLVAVALWGHYLSYAAFEHDTAMLSENPYTTLLQVAFAALFLGLTPARTKAAWLAISSTAMALAILTRPAGLFLVVVYAMVVVFMLFRRERRKLAAFLLPMPAILLLMCVYNYRTIHVFNVTAWGEANLAGATFPYWLTDRSYPEHVNAGIQEIRGIIKSHLDRTGVSDDVLRTSWHPDKLNPVFVWGWDHSAIAMAMKMGKGDEAAGRRWIRRISFDSIAKQPDIYAKFVMSMLFNYFEPPRASDFRVYLAQRAYVFYVERRFSANNGNPLLTRMAKEFADSAPPPTVAIAAAATASGAPGYELIAVAPTKLWRLYRVLYLLHDRILVTVLPVWCFIMLTLWSSVALWRTRASDPVVFAVFVLCVSIIGASLVVSLVEYSQPRYSYPMDWALFMTLPLLVLMWKKTQPVSQPAMTANATLKTGSQTYSSAIETAVNYTRWIISRCVPFIGRSIMEVGLGHGGYRRFLPQSARYLGLDIDHESVTQAKSRHPEDTFLVADVTDPTLRSHLHGRGIDTILCINVLEHIAEDRKAIENLMAVLEPGGHLVVLSPAFPVLYSSLDEMAGHVRRYTKADLPRLVPPGMTLVRSEYFNAIGGIGWFVNKLFRHDDLNSTAVNSQIVVFDRFLVPISRAVDVMCRRVFGQSIIFAIRKP